MAALDHPWNVYPAIVGYGRGLQAVCSRSFSNVAMLKKL